MSPLSLGDILDAVGGTLVPMPGCELFQIVGVSTDSRHIRAGELFVALRGDNFDGHHYLQVARDRGAVAAIVDNNPGAAADGLALIVVPDTKRAMGKLAAQVRRDFTRCQVVAVAGSNGKTSTKHLITSALSSRLRGSMSPKSFNNDVGVPLSIFPVDPEQDFVVLEIGTNHPGEIAPLADIARPDVAVITNCTAEHLEGLGDLAGVRAENARLVDSVRSGGLLVVNGDDDLLLRAVEHFDGDVVRFGFQPGNDLFATDVQVNDAGTTFHLNGGKTRVTVPMLGRHNALNALVAVAIGRRFGLSDGAIVSGLANSSRPDMRMQRVDAHGITILNDAYNANPASMRAGLETLLEFQPPGRNGKRVAVLGDMRELGETSEQYHREAGAFLANQKNEIGLLVCVGECSKWIAESAVSNGFSSPIERFADSSAAAKAVSKLVGRGDLVLVKGSRGIRLERVVEQIVAGEGSIASPE